MTDLETRLRESFEHRAADVPPTLGLAETAIRRGRFVRRARVGAVGLVAAIACAGALVASGDGGGRHDKVNVPVVTPQPSPSPSARGDVAEPGWRDSLVPNTGEQSYTAAVGAHLYSNDGNVPLKGRAVAVTVVPSGTVVTVEPASGRVETSFYPQGSSSPSWTVQDTAYGHAVDPTGTKVALALTTERREVVDLATGVASDVQVLTEVNAAGTPVAWTSAGVLLTAGDGAGTRPELWQPATGQHRVLGRVGEYGIAQDMVGDVVALDLGDGPCVEVSRLSQVGGTPVGCAGSAQLGAGGQDVLVWGGGTAQVIRVGGKVGTSLRLPKHGVVSAAFAGSSHVVAVVRALTDAGAPEMDLVLCGTDGGACQQLVTTDEEISSATVARFVGF